MALNLICVDESTRQTIDIPIRPRSVKDLKNDVHRKQFRSTDAIKLESESKHKIRFDRHQSSDSSAKTGNVKCKIRVNDTNRFENVYVSFKKRKVPTKCK